MRKKIITFFIISIVIIITACTTTKKPKEEVSAKDTSEIVDPSQKKENLEKDKDVGKKEPRTPPHSVVQKGSTKKAATKPTTKPATKPTTKPATKKTEKAPLDEIIASPKDTAGQKGVEKKKTQPAVRKDLSKEKAPQNPVPKDQTKSAPSSSKKDDAQDMAKNNIEDIISDTTKNGVKEAEKVKPVKEPLLKEQKSPAKTIPQDRAEQVAKIPTQEKEMQKAPRQEKKVPETSSKKEAPPSKKEVPSSKKEAPSSKKDAQKEPTPKVLDPIEQGIRDAIVEYESGRRGPTKEQREGSLESEMRGTPSEYPEKEPEAQKKNIPSRSVKVFQGQKVEALYPGTGWVYLGEESSQKGIRYMQRKLHGKDSLFTFNTDKVGSYILNFSFFDVFTDDFITDSLQVIVNPKQEIGIKQVRAPAYKKDPTIPSSTETIAKQETKKEQEKSRAPTEKMVPPRRQEGTTSQGRDDTNKERASSEDSSRSSALVLENEGIYDEPLVSVAPKQEKESASEKRESSDLLAKARREIGQGLAAQAHSTLDSFFATANSNIDEGWFLRGQAYEINGETKNIRSALQAYKKVTSEFPQSTRWKDSDARIRYIKKFYINID